MKKLVSLVLLVLLVPLVLLSTPALAQSNLTYEVRVATTAENTLLASFPDSYAAEKVNITLDQLVLLDPLAQLDQLESIDFVFADHQTSNLESFDSIYTYTDEAGTSWTVWRNHQEPKNRSRRVLVVNGRNAFETYLHETVDTHRSYGWIWFVFAGLILAGLITYVAVVLYRRRKEKSLSAVEQETLRRKRMGQRRHYISQAYLWLLLLVLYAPIALIAVFSFTESKILGNWTGFSMELYANHMVHRHHRPRGGRRVHHPRHPRRHRYIQHAVAATQDGAIA